MKIKFDTATMTEAEARGLVALFREQFPAVAAMWKDEIPRERIQIKQFVDVSERFDPAPDGYASKPADLEPVNPHEDAVGLDAPERDTDGIPWDARIHASTKTTNKDGTWTRRRNTPDEVFDKVMAELKAANTAMTLEAAAGLTAPAAPSAAEAFTPPASVVIPPHVPVPPVPAAVPQPPVPVPPVPVAPTIDDKSAEAVEIMKAVNAKQVPADKLAELVGKAGLKGLAEVFTASIEARRIIAAELAAL